MRLPVIALLAAAACVPAGWHPAVPRDEAPVMRRVHTDLDAARELDQEGVRSFREGRLADAIRYFRAALRLGGPSSELWNIARCRERMDDPEGAAEALQQYLAQRDLGTLDRLDAERELAALRSRSSTLTVTTVPPGAIITVDGKQTAGPTPVSLEVRPGAHTLSVHREGYTTATRPLEARFGRAVIVSLELARGPVDSR
jgi:hypothetical protein